MACALGAACSASPEGPDAGDVTPDAGDVTPDAGPTAPDTTLTGGPEGTTHVITATFTLASDTEGATFECVLDEGAFEACTTPVTFDDVADGTHTFQVRAVAAGQTDATPASHTWTVNTLRQPRKWVDRAGNVYIADTGNCVVRKVTVADGKIATVAGVSGECSSTGDGGPATAAHINYPLSIALGPTGDLYIAEDASLIRKVDHVTGTITTVVGGGTGETILDGTSPTSGALGGNFTLFVNAAGDLFFGQDRKLRVLRASTGLVTTIVGGATTCTAPATGAIATDVCFADNQVYSVVGGAGASTYFGAGPQVWRLEAAGTLTHVAGVGTWSSAGDNGPAIAAELGGAVGLAVDANGDLFIADTNNESIRKVTTSTGVITTIAGTLGTAGTTGDGAAASAALLDSPGDVAFDAAGNLYIADTYNNVVRKVDVSTGVISTVAGNYTRGYGGDGADAKEAQLSRPGGFWWWWD